MGSIPAACAAGPEAITTVAGNGIRGYSGDGGPATSAMLEAPSGVTVDNSGNLYIIDFKRIRKVDTSGTIATAAGTGISGYSGDGGPATEARLDMPQSVAVDVYGNLYIADLSNSIRKVDTNGVIATIAGNGRYESGGQTWLRLTPVNTNQVGQIPSRVGRGRKPVCVRRGLDAVSGRAAHLAFGFDYDVDDSLRFT